jgi:hypothetical protein
MRLSNYYYTRYDGDCEMMHSNAVGVHNFLFIVNRNSDYYFVGPPAYW